MNYSQIKNDFFQNGFVHLNIGNKDLSAEMDLILDQFEQTLIVGKHHVEGDKRLQIVSEEEMFGADYLHWHTDQSYSPGNFNGTLLAFDTADHETYTEFADMQKAYEDLPPHIIEYFQNVVCKYGVPTGLDDLISPAQKRILERSRVEWPLITTHPVTGKKSLYFSPLTLVETNIPLEVDRLVEHCEKYTFKHHWRPGDILLWDNRRVIHRRPAFEGHRQLYRTCFRYE